jgi:hypothetical protein
MNTEATTVAGSIPAITTAATTAAVAPRTPRRARTRLVAALATLGAAVGLSVAAASAASAAVAPTTNFHAECNVSSVTAVAPDMRYYPNNAVAWAPRLFIYTSTGWQPYRTGPTQAALGDNLSSNPWTIAGSWLPEWVDFGSLPHNAYYQVRFTYGWVGPNSAGLVGKDVLFPHEVAQGNFNFASYSRSTSSYCYIP